MRRAVRWLIRSLAVSAAFAGDAMPVARQNELVQKYCAVCHTDAVRDGGLSLEHFDAGRAAPSLAAMMVSKLTSGVLLKTVMSAAFDPAAAALVAQKMKSGAMGAAGLPLPDKAAIAALIDALASGASGAQEWVVQRTGDPAAKAEVLTASILRELPSVKAAGEASLYRLVLTCNIATHAGEIQLAWAPAPARGTLSATVDGKTLYTFKVDGSESGQASINLAPGMPLPARTLLVKNLFPDQQVEFPFDNLVPAARQSLGACFEESNPGH